MKKIIAASLFTSIIFSNAFLNANAVEWPYKHELTHTNVKLKHVPFWLFDENDHKSAFVKKNEKTTEISDSNMDFSENWANNNEWSFVDDLFGGSFFGEDESREDISWEDTTYQESENTDTNSNDEQDDFLNDLFWGDFEWEEEGSIIIDNESWEEWIQNEETWVGEEWLWDIDELFWEIFWKSIEHETTISLDIQKIDIKKRKLRIKIAQKKKRILSKKLALIQAL